MQPDSAVPPLAPAGTNPIEVTIEWQFVDDGYNASRCGVHLSALRKARPANYASSYAISYVSFYV